MRRLPSFRAAFIALAVVTLMACGNKESTSSPASEPASPSASPTASASEPDAAADAAPPTAAPVTDPAPAPRPVESAAVPGPGADHVVVEVNGQPIRAKKLLGAVEMNRMRALSMGHAMTPEEGAELRQAAVSAFVADELLYQAAKADGIVASDAQVAEEVSSLRSGFATPEQYRTFLQQAGMAEDGVADDAARRLIVRAYVKKIAGNTTVPVAEARAFYDANKEQFAAPEQVRAAIIVVLSKPGDAEPLRAEARKRIEDAHKRAVAGDDFAALARQVSQIPNAATGGDLGSFGRGDGLPPKIEDIAFSTPPGQVSPVFETPSGLCVVKTMARTPAGTRPFEEIKPLLIEELGRRKEGAAVEARVDDLRKVATIEIKDPSFLPQPAGAVPGN